MSVSLHVDFVARRTKMAAISRRLARPDAARTIAREVLAAAGETPASDTNDGRPPA